MFYLTNEAWVSTLSLPKTNGGAKNKTTNYSNLLIFKKRRTND